MPGRLHVLLCDRSTAPGADVSVEEKLSVNIFNISGSSSCLSYGWNTPTPLESRTSAWGSRRPWRCGQDTLRVRVSDILPGLMSWFEKKITVAERRTDFYCGCPAGEKSEFGYMNIYGQQYLWSSRFVLLSPENVWQNRFINIYALIDNKCAAEISRLGQPHPNRDKTRL